MCKHTTKTNTINHKMNYDDIIASKRIKPILTGFEITNQKLHPLLFDFQKYCTRLAINHGRFALFEDCGLGKTFQGCEWSKQVSVHTGKPTLSLAPFAVVDQTIAEAERFGYEISYAEKDSNKPFQITNYEQLENINPDDYSAIWLDECFAPDTIIQIIDINGNLEDKYIKECEIGDKVLNCTGIDTITKIKRKKVQYGIQIGFNGKQIICSPNHPFFTDRGWVLARNIQKSDNIVSTDKSMRILRGGFSSEQNIGIKEKILHDILQCEMENETTSIHSKSAQFDSCEETRRKHFKVVENGCGSEKCGTDKEFKSNAECGIQGEMLSYIKSDETQTFTAWGKWSRDDIATAIDEGCVVTRMDFGICHIVGAITTRLSNKLQSRFGELEFKDCYRSGWELSLFEKRERQKEGSKTGFFGVESFEILEQTDIRLDKYRDETGSLYFYDLEIERHPSFTINNCLVHNSSILKNLTGAIRNKIIKGFETTPFKLCTTATPSPNDPMELGNHSEFLNIMPYNEMLAMFFTHDGSDTSKWKIKGHAKDRFYEWVNSWAIMLSNPADIGFDATGYDLPALNFIERQIKTPKRDNGKLVNDDAVSATNINNEFRLTVVPRLEEVVKIITSKPDEAFSIWIKHDEEGERLKKLIPSAIEVKGSDKPDYKKKMLLDFGADKFPYMITKAKIASFGLNWQNVHNAIIASVGFGFEEVYQLIRRHLRFGQKFDVNAWLITTDTMQNVINTINRKIKAHNEMQKGMTKAHLKKMEQDKGIVKKEQVQSFKGKNFEVFRGNCVKLIHNIKDNSLGFSMFSPPFPSLYVYSNHDEDMGNNKDFNKFKSEFGFMVKPLFDKMQAGRNVVVHCQDLPIQKGKEGFIGLRDFSGMIHDTFLEAGFVYHSRVTLWKNPVIEMTRTHALGLLHAQIKKDAGMSRVGLPDYLLVFRKPGIHENPVKHQDIDVNGPNFMNVDMWQKIASPVWFDVNFGNTLNIKGTKDKEDEAHICPLSLDTIERATLLWSNPGDLCYTPFLGIGSEPFKWLEMGRKAIGNELKESYFNVSVKNCKAAEFGVEAKTRQHLLFA